MGIGLASNVIIREIESELTELDSAQREKIAAAVANVMDKNNQEIDRELGRRFANIERLIGRR